MIQTRSAPSRAAPGSSAASSLRTASSGRCSREQLGQHPLGARVARRLEGLALERGVLADGEQLGAGGVREQAGQLCVFGHEASLPS